MYFSEKIILTAAQLQYLIQYLKKLSWTCKITVRTTAISLRKKSRIRSFSGPSAGKYGLEKLRIRTLFTQCLLIPTFSPQILYDKFIRKYSVDFWNQKQKINDFIHVLYKSRR